MDSTKALAALGTNDELKRSMESIASSGKMTGLDALAALGTDDELKRSMESITAAGKLTAFDALAGHGIHDEVKRSMESITAPGKLTGLDALAAAGKTTAFDALAALGSRDELARSFEHTSLLARGVDDVLSNIRVPTRTYDMPTLETPNLELPPNPIWETNRQLAELTGTVSQLVDVARRQAELSQAIRNASDLALKNSIQSGDEAKAATQLTRQNVRLTFRAIIVAILIGILNVGFAVYVYHRESANAEVRRQEEIRVLREISNQLKELNYQAPGNPAIKR